MTNPPFSVVYLKHTKQPKFGSYRSIVFSVNNVHQQLKNLKESLDSGFVIDRIEVREDF